MLAGPAPLPRAANFRSGLQGVCLKMAEDQSANIPMKTEVPPTPQNETLGIETPQNEANVENEDQQEDRSSPNKRGLTSKAWKHFKREEIDDKWKAICKYCDKKLLGETKQGTKHLHDHIRICKLHTVRSPRQSIIKTLEQSTGSIGNKAESVVVGNYTFTQDVATKELARMIILHEYPIMMVDLIGFRRFIYVPAPPTAEVICDHLVQCLLDWSVDRNLTTLTVDNCSTNDALIDHLFEKISPSSFVLSGELFHMRWCAHILNPIEKDGLSTISRSIEKIRDTVTFWVATPKREEKFRDTYTQLSMTYVKKLAFDCRTRWNSTYLMLVSTLPYQEIFKCLRQRDSQYKCLPSGEDWKMASGICNKLEMFFSVTELFSGTQYPTSNIYFPKVCEIRLALRSWQTSSCDIIQSMAANMILKFDKYWGLINGVMAIGAVLDPRYKMTLLNYFFPLMYGDDAPMELERVKKLCEVLVDEY